MTSTRQPPNSSKILVPDHFGRDILCGFKTFQAEFARGAEFVKRIQTGSAGSLIGRGINACLLTSMHCEGLRYSPHLRDAALNREARHIILITHELQAVLAGPQSEVAALGVSISNVSFSSTLRRCTPMRPSVNLVCAASSSRSSTPKLVFASSRTAAEPKSNSARPPPHPELIAGGHRAVQPRGRPVIRSSRLKGDRVLNKAETGDATWRVDVLRRRRQRWRSQMCTPCRHGQNCNRHNRRSGSASNAPLMVAHSEEI